MSDYAPGEFEDLDATSNPNPLSRVLNNDVPSTSISMGSDLGDRLDLIDRLASSRTRATIPTDNLVTSFRIIPDPQNVTHRAVSARHYKPPTVQNVVHLTKSERVYNWRQKFYRLQSMNPTLEIPDSSDPDALERMYAEALRTNSYASSSGTWMLYFGVGNAFVQWLLTKAGVPNVQNYAKYQLEILKYYPQLINELGNPGGPSIGSSWPPWMKLTFIVVIQSIIFLVVTSITKNDSIAFHVQRMASSTGVLGGKAQPTAESDAAGDNAINNIGGLLGNFISGGEGGIMGMLGGLLSGQVPNAMDDIDLDNLPAPVDEPNPSNRLTPFD